MHKKARRGHVGLSGHIVMALESLLQRKHNLLRRADEEGLIVTRVAKTVGADRRDIVFVGCIGDVQLRLDALE